MVWGGIQAVYYRDRSDAGRRLAELLVTYRSENPLVLAMPRGGVVVGYEIAHALNAPLDVLVARKLGAPDNPEFAFGAIGPGGVRYLNERVVAMLGLDEADIEAAISAETKELNRRMHAYRGDMPQGDFSGRTIILVDDGLATGATARAAILSVKQHRPRRIILAVPVSPVDTAEALRDEVDELICPVIQADFYAIGQWYDNFDQTSDEEVQDLLARASKAA